MKMGIAFLLLVVLALVPAPVLAQEPSEETFCTEAVGYESLEAMKDDLLTQAQYMAVDKLFGKLIDDATAEEDSGVPPEQIRAAAVDLIQIEDEANYHNGDEFAQVCVTIAVSVAEADLAQFKPVKLTKHHCVEDPDMTTRQLSTFTKEEAIVQAVLEYAPYLS